MPLISQQDIVVVQGPGSLDDLVDQLKNKLDSYPPVRIVSTSATIYRNPAGIAYQTLIAVIETI